MDLMTQQKLERRQRILESVRELIGERGFDGVTMRDLARRSRVSVPTLYNQFGGKDNLLAAAVTEHLTGTLGGQGTPEGSGHELLLATLEGVGTAMTGQPDYHRALVHAFMSTRATASLQAGVTGQLVEVLEHGLRQMALQGELVGWASPSVLAQRLTAACVGATTTWALGLLDDEALRAALLFDTCTLLLAVSRGPAQAAFETAARRSQATLGPVVPPARAASTGG